MKNYFIFIILFLTNSGFSEPLKEKSLDLQSINKLIDLEWNYNYSSDVLFGEVIKNRFVKSNHGKCKVESAVVEIKESFKGPLLTNHLVNIVGLSAHEIIKEKSLQLMFLKPFKATEYPGFGECENSNYENYLVVHNWCCSIVSKEKYSLVVYDMLNSETKSKNYLINSDTVFRELRRLKKGKF